MGVERYKAANVFTILQQSAFCILSVWVMVKFMGGRGVWFATPVTLVLVLICSAVYISRQDGDLFKNKRLILRHNFGSALGKELNISATTMLEIEGMSRLSGLFCQENGFDRKHGNRLSLCIEELGMNIIKHGFSDGKPHSIDIRILIKDDELILRVRDDCKPFNLLERYELIRQQEADPGKNIGIRMIVNSCRDIKYLSTMSTNNLIIKI